MGPLTLDEYDDWWNCAVWIAEQTIGFKIGGDVEPNGALVAHAHDIVRSFDAFSTLIREFLAAEATRLEPDWPEAKNEINQLVIEDICLFWPERPDDGMIFFKGSNENWSWRCDYIGRKPEALGFDC